MLIGCTGLTYALLGLYYQATWMYWTLAAVFVLLMFLVLFGVYLLIILLLWNARIVARRERATLANRLTLILALALLAYVVLSLVLDQFQLPAWARMLRLGILAVLLFAVVHVVVFLLSVLLCNLARPRRRQDYIVVLGSGLIGGKVTPLLAGRLRRAVRFYQKQAKKRPPPKLVLSGGRGGDEAVSEAGAMRAWALENGIPEQHLLLEDRARNTAENMLFSKQLMERDAGGARYRAIYATSNYHLLRAGVYARRAGLRIDGIGCKTALYYLPNALLREYLAYLKMHYKGLLAALLVFFILACATFWLPDALWAAATRLTERIGG